ncbi:hypothetical protein I5907_13630 [Panacibacter sp. DH6]|uniref:Uncharacterized protein n=1 Tax=Panacibacter microcysteis TaxID=2793269 RepID=A0A931GYQ8_9BACT|nr:DUF6000 family protein [Panacibacter microcysteis]MBG9377277.1 hypothetical protein [Panacibacter microcysteis]
MDDLNEMPGLHSAGATVRHLSPFDSSPTHKNDKDLSADFIKKWVVPYYMEIGCYDNLNWIEHVKEIKPEITQDVCLNLLGDFNWRTRLVGSYFAAVKNYKELINIIGTHLLKSEVCCVGHIYALTLAFFNDEKCIGYLNKYLEYYLAKSSLYFDQKIVIEAVLYLDRKNQTDYFNQHLDNWKKLTVDRKKQEEYQRQELAKLYPELNKETNSASEKHLEKFSTDFFEEQIYILTDLNQYSR